MTRRSGEDFGAAPRSPRALVFYFVLFYFYLLPAADQDSRGVGSRGGTRKFRGASHGLPSSGRSSSGPRARATQVGQTDHAPGRSRSDSAGLRGSAPRPQPREPGPARRSPPVSDGRAGSRAPSFQPRSDRGAAVTPRTPRSDPSPLPPPISVRRAHAGPPQAPTRPAAQPADAPP